MARTKAFDEEQVLDKALNLFWCHGYNNTSMQDLVDGLGINRSSIYDTYGDKHQLFVAALERYRQKMAGALLELIRNSSSVKTTLNKIFELTLQETFSDKDRKGCFMVNTTVEVAPHDPGIAGLINANNQVIEDAFYEAIRQAQNSGEIRTHHAPRALARFFFNTSTGLRVAAKANPDQQVFQDVIRIALSVLE
jgi:TetR/AcrR family transcriptional repressor of nem operon